MRSSLFLASCALGAVVSVGLDPSGGLRFGPREARADSLIKRPGSHINYTVELEPHLDIGFLHYGGYGGGNGFRGYNGFGDPDIGAGFRASIPVGGTLFVPRINDTIAITFGIDLTGCGSYCANHVEFRAPVGLQWNFFFTRELSLFADMGGILNADADGAHPDFFFMLGGRYLFNPRTAVTFRIGYPFVSVGVSFFVG